MGAAEKSVQVLQGGEASFIAEACAAQRAARAMRAGAVKLGQIVFFSTSTGDAWMLDPQERTAACLARDGDSLPIPIRESAAELAIEWHADYRIQGRAFVVVERDSGSARTVLGYPIAEIQGLSCEPAAHSTSDSRLLAARERLKTGRNHHCPCGSGRKHKQCCLRGDEELLRRATAARQAEVVGDVDPAAPTALSENPDEHHEPKRQSRYARLPGQYAPRGGRESRSIGTG